MAWRARNGAAARQAVRATRGSSLRRWARWRRQRVARPMGIAKARASTGRVMAAHPVAAPARSIQWRRREFFQRRKAQNASRTRAVRGTWAMSMVEYSRRPQLAIAQTEATKAADGSI